MNNIAVDNAINELYMHTARTTMAGFMLYMKNDYELMWYNRLICSKLDDFANCKSNRLIINMPPQHGKSELISRKLPAFLFGRNPNEKIIAASCDATLASKFSKDVQRIIDTNIYKNLFPATYINSKDNRQERNLDTHYIRTNRFFEICKNNGYYQCAGVGGSINGESATVLILDDPYVNYQSANSSTIREGIWDWFVSTFLTRKSSELLRVLIVHTRWHEDDITGRLLTLEPEDWDVVSLPAIANEESVSSGYDIRQLGEPLWANRHPLIELEKTKERSGSIVWNSVYQQRPSPQGSGLFNRKNFVYANLINGLYSFTANNVSYTYNASDCYRFATCDLSITASSNSDYTVVSIIDYINGFIILHDVYRKQVDGADHIDIIKSLIQSYNIKLMYIENNQYQSTLVQSALMQGLPVQGVRADKSKELRALGIAAKFEAKKVIFNNNISSLNVLENELLQFPQGKNDDFLDAMSYAANAVMNINQYIYEFSKNNNTGKQVNKTLKYNKNKFDFFNKL
jgi:predicted phage terminase large subunit-like protein